MSNNLNTDGERIAAALESCDWSGVSIGNKEILKAAVRELRSLQAWQRGAISCREAEEARIEGYRRAAPIGLRSQMAYIAAYDPAELEKRPHEDLQAWANTIVARARRALSPSTNEKEDGR